MPAAWVLPGAYRRTLRQALHGVLHPWSQAGLLPACPFRTDLTADGLRLVTALKHLPRVTRHPASLVGMALKRL